MERIVIAAYEPRKGKEEALKVLMQAHWFLLKKEGLVSDRKPILMKAKDGTMIEVFGWKSKEAIASAHADPSIRELWKQYAEVCEYVPIGVLDEAEELFSGFDPL